LGLIMGKNKRIPKTWYCYLTFAFSPFVRYQALL